MTKKITARKIWIALFLWFFAFSVLLTAGKVSAGPAKHTVQKGDTLWGICEKYYGNPNLWPKLWQMNPFVTNPHLLSPGDVITLLEEEAIKKAEAEKKPPVEPEKKSPVMQGIDLSDRINFEALGYLSLVEVEPLGVIESATSTKKALSSGDKVFVHFAKGPSVKPGDALSIAHRSDLIRHPLTGKPMGYLVSMKGTIYVKEPLQKGIYLAEVGKTLSEVFVNDLVMPPAGTSTCLRPLSTDKKLYGNIVATHDNRRVIGRGTIVYLDSGFKDGIQTGGIFDLIKIHKLPMIDTKHDSFDVISKEFIDTLSKEQYLADFLKKIEDGKTLYESTVGKLLIIDSRPDTSSGIVLTSREELEVGAFVKGMPWVEPPEFITSLPSCVIR
jgi:LysM repeat protein